jgi:hypothetical protein
MFSRRWRCFGALHCNRCRLGARTRAQRSLSTGGNPIGNGCANGARGA